MRNFSKKIITSVLTLVLTVVALGTGVFAWFSMNTKTTATGFEGSAESATGGFYISLDGETWVNTVDLGELINDGFKGAAPYVFTDLTSLNGTSFYKIDFDKSDGSLEANPATSGYVEFDLYFLTGEDAINVFLITLEITSDQTKWSAEKDLILGGRSVNQGDLMEAELAHALRVSFEEVDWQDGQSVTYYADAPNLEPVSIFENAASNDNGLEFGNTTGFGAIANNFAVQYYNAIHGVGSLASYTAGLTTRGDTVLSQNGDKVFETHLIHADNQETIRNGKDASFNHGAKIVVRVWLEGWDAEAFNALFGGKAEVNMTFEVR